MSAPAKTNRLPQRPGTAISTADGTEQRWSPGPPSPLLDDGEVHVWQVELASVPDELGSLLCDEERARAERILGTRKRVLWFRARAVLRELLGRYLREDPRALKLADGAHGKPKLAVARRSSNIECLQLGARRGRLSFNLSHSGGLALYAFARAGAVGIDIERPDRRIEAVSIAERVLGPAEARRLEGFDSAHRQREFLRAWVHHEAALKCLGVGLGGPPADLAASRPWVVELDVGAGAAAAVAAAQTARLRCWNWRRPGSSS